MAYNPSNGIIIVSGNPPARDTSTIVVGGSQSQEDILIVSGTIPSGNVNTEDVIIVGDRVETTGPPGPQGPPGQIGPPGIGSIWLSGIGAPSNIIGSLNDYYLDTLSGAIYNKTSNGWILTVSSIIGPPGTSVEPTYTNLDTTPIAVGGIDKNSTFNNKTMKEMWDALLYPELFPTTPFIEPSFTITANVNLLQIIGDVINPTFTVNLNRGSITPSYGTNGYRANFPYTLNFTCTFNELNGSRDVYITNYNLGFTNKTVGTTPITATATVNIINGEQPLSSKGNQFSTPFIGSLGSKSVTINGVYPWFGTSVSISSVTQQPLALMNSQYVQINMVAESDTEKQIVQFPAAWSNIVGVAVLNTLTNKWEWVGGSAANSILTFTKSALPLQKTISGLGVGYYQYTHNGTKTGVRSLKFYTTTTAPLN